MSETSLNIITTLLLTVVPLVLFLLHIVLSTRKRWFWSILVPFLWTALGTWMIVAGYKDFGVNTELFIFFLVGDILLISVTVLLRKLKKRKK